MNKTSVQHCANCGNFKTFPSNIYCKTCGSKNGFRNWVYKEENKIETKDVLNILKKSKIK